MKPNLPRRPALALLLAALLSLSLLAGCQAEKKSSALENPSVPLHFSSYTQENEEGLPEAATVWNGVWDVSTGSLTLSPDPVLTIQDMQNPDSIFYYWDGDRQYVVKDPSFFLPQQSDFTLRTADPLPEGSHRIYGPGYQADYTQDGQWTVTPEGKDPVAFPALSPVSTPDASVAPEELELLGHTLQNGQLELVYFYQDPSFSFAETSKDSKKNLLIHVVLNLDSKKVQQEEAVPIPDIYGGNIIGNIMDSDSFPIVQNKLYFNFRQTVAYYDLATHKFTTLDNLPDQVDKLLAPAERITYEETAYSPAIIGSTQEIVFFNTEYQEPDNSASHDLVVAIYGDQVLGFLDHRTGENTSSILCYDSSLKETARIDKDISPGFPALFSRPR